MIKNKLQMHSSSSKKSFSLHKLYVVLALTYTQMSIANPTCSIPTKSLSQDSELAHEFKPLAPQSEAVDLKQWLPEATSVFQTEAKFTPNTHAFEGSLTEGESISMLTNLRRYAGWATEGLEALGPVFDVVALGLWTNDLVKTFTNKDSSTLDKAASILYLVPVVGQATEAIAQADHFNENLNNHIHELTTKMRYVDKDTTQPAQVLKQKMNEIINNTYQNLNHYYQQIFTRMDYNIVYGLKTYQKQALSWLTLLQKTIRHLDLQFYKSLYYELYKPPYNLTTQQELKYTPLECDARAFDNEQFIKNASANSIVDYQQKLESCLRKMTRNTMRPLIDVLHEHHPHMDMGKWIAQGHKLTQAKKILVQHVQQEILNTRDMLEKKLVQQFKQHLDQIKDNPQLSMYLNNTRRITSDLAFKHWVADEFADIPTKQLSVDSKRQILTITPPQVCSDTVKSISSSFPFIISIWPLNAYCNGMQSILNKREGPHVIQFDHKKSSDIQNLNHLITSFINPINQIVPETYIKYRMKFGYDIHDAYNIAYKYAYAFQDIANRCQTQPQQCSERIWLGEPLTMKEKNQLLGKNALRIQSHDLIVELKQKNMVIFEAFQQQLRHLIAAGHSSFSTQDFYKLLSQYPFNQGWYIEDNFDKLGDLAPTLLYMHLKNIDKQNQTSFVANNNTQLPARISAFLNEEKLHRFTQRLQDSFKQYQQEDTSTTHKFFKVNQSAGNEVENTVGACNRYAHLTAKIKKLNQSTLNLLPFWNHMLEKLIHQREKYEQILIPLCEKQSSH